MGYRISLRGQLRSVILGTTVSIFRLSGVLPMEMSAADKRKPLSISHDHALHFLLNSSFYRAKNHQVRPEKLDCCLGVKLIKVRLVNTNVF